MRLSIILTVFISLCSLKAFAEAQWAIVTSAKAIVYADATQTSPIGYVSKGKKFKVGTVARNDGHMLPLIVSGRIAYVRVEDIAVAHDKVLLQLPTDRYLEKQRYDFYQKDITLFLHGFSSNLESGRYDSNVADSEGGTFLGTTVQGLVMVEPHWHVGTSFTYERTSEETQSLSAIYINLDSVYKFYDRYKYYIGHFVFLGFSPNSRLEVESKFKLSGQSYQLGTAVEFGYLIDRVSLKLDLGYKFQAFSNYNVPDGFEEFKPVVHGPHIAFGVAVNY